MIVELTSAEAKVFLILLERAKKDYSDTDAKVNVLWDANLPEQAASEMRLGMANLGVLEPEETGSRGPYLHEWLLFAYLQEKVRRALAEEDKILGGKYEGDARREVAAKEDDLARRALDGR